MKFDILEEMSKRLSFYKAESISMDNHKIVKLEDHKRHAVDRIPHAANGLGLHFTFNIPAGSVQMDSS
jgi:hypothetical protein